ncbi:MAG TPA: hypothetical protein VNL69_08830, partial [Bacteroidota bacterium]|nr:hypothetical protein [Bacteroidota bacterium]
TADVQELADDGMPLIGKKSQDVQFELADQNLVPELRDVLARAEVGGRYRVRFSTQHGDHAHQYHIEVTVKRIEKVELPDFNDEFVRKITGDSEMTAEKFLARMREDIQAFWDRESERLLDQAIINELVRMHQFNVPASLVNAYLDSMLEEVRERARNQKRPAQIDEERFRNENRGYATYQAKWEILRRRMIEAEGIAVSDEDIERAAARDAQLLGLEKDRVAMYYRQSQSGQERILTEKLMKLLKDHARITERVVDNREES